MLSMGYSTSPVFLITSEKQRRQLSRQFFYNKNLSLLKWHYCQVCLILLSFNVNADVLIL